MPENNLVHQIIDWSVHSYHMLNVLSMEAGVPADIRRELIKQLNAAPEPLRASGERYSASAIRKVLG